MESAEIRQRFLDFFAARDHTVVPSASLLLDDPTLLFVNAGMVPFKPYFLGEAVPPWPRATSVQKVVRTLDIEEVGKTTRHASFFQMCGNFSFGDYFKAKAIPLAWELLTLPVADGGFGLDPERLWVTVYLDDDEAADIWRDVVGLPPERIQRRGMADNYWSMGVPGPCGPCSEIYYDRGPDYGQEGGPIVDEERYLEVWNLVFMQSARGAGGGKEDFEILGDLPAQNIDTGLGLERMAALLQGVDNIYEIDTSRRVLETATELTGKRYGDNEDDDVALRVVTDHSRTCSFLISDGVQPGNEGRGYVLRRLLRRVVMNMRQLGAQGPVMAELVSATIDAMAPQYPELRVQQERIITVSVAEEQAFDRTLRHGITRFEAAVGAVRETGATTLPSDEAFALHDTYGFPIDLTLEMAAEQGLDVDREGFTRLMQEQRSRAKADAQARKSGVVATTVYRDAMEAAGETEFTGYDEYVSEVLIKGLVRDGEPVTAAGEGETVEVVLDRSPFYAEGGGQLGDHGSIRLADGTVLSVFDVQKPVPGLWVHRARVEEGLVSVDAAALGEVDVDRRRAISRSHTATHMIHKAFREALGDTATQMGSENSPGRLRFDFPSPQAVPASVLRDVEARVNELALDDLMVHAEVMTQQQAMDMGAMALFGEKYGDRVRVVSVGDWAHELCGGTHAQRSGQLGVVSLIHEGSVGAGVRRIEALVGSDAYQYLAAEHVLVDRISELMKAPGPELPGRIETMISRLRAAEKEIESMKSKALSANLDQIVGAAQEVSGVQTWMFRAPDGLGGGDLRDLVLRARDAAGTQPAALVGASVDGAKVAVVCATNAPARDLGVRAGALLQAVMPAVGGRGGGKDDIAQGGGGNPAGLAEAFEAAAAAIRGSVGG